MVYSFGFYYLNMENSQKYTPAAQAMIDKLRQTCTNHNNAAIMPAHLLLELSQNDTRSAELMEAVVGASRLADLRSELTLPFMSPRLLKVKNPTSSTARLRLSSSLP